MMIIKQTAAWRFVVAALVNGNAIAALVNGNAMQFHYYYFNESKDQFSGGQWEDWWEVHRRKKDVKQNERINHFK